MGDSRLVKGVACFCCSRAVRKPYFIHDVIRIRRQVRLRNFNILGFTVAFNTFFLSFSKGGSRFVNFRQRLSFRGLLAAAAIFAAVPLNASANNDQAGVVVSARGGEEVRRAGSQRWQPVKVRVALFPGDRVRTGRYGGLSILLTDETQMRLHPGSDLVVVQVRKDSQSESSSLRLLAGSLWSRARSLFRGLAGRINRGRGNSVSVSTPTATIGIRGTDWHVHIDSDGHTHLTVISGEGEIANGSGAIAVRSGEVGSARVDGGKPASRQVVSLKARPLIALDLSYDWLDLLKLTPHRHTVLHAAHKYVSSIEDAFRAYDLGHLQDIEDWLSKQSQGDARTQLLRAVTAVRTRDYNKALRLLTDANLELDGREGVVAELLHVGIDAQTGHFEAAESRLAHLIAKHPDNADVVDFEIWLTARRGSHADALSMAQKAAARFTEDGRFHSHAALLAFNLDDREAMRDALDSAHDVDPEHHGAWHGKGLYAHYVEPHGEKALAAYQRAVRAHKSYAPAWNNLGLVAFDLGRYDEAKAALERAIALDPHGSEARANLGFVLTFLHRLDAAQAMFDSALAIAPGEPFAELGLGYLEMLRGVDIGGVIRSLRASTGHPHLPRVSSGLGAAYYQNDRFESAKKSFEDARRIDPNDPVPDLLGSIMATDTFQAGEAIRRARDGFDKTLRAESFAVENLSNAKSGSATLGAAFTNLGLHDWGGFYTQLAFDPYLANGYFYLSDANQLDSEDARLGAFFQGLLIDPTAVSAPTRYYEPFRSPRTDVSVGLRFGTDGAFFGEINGTLQGMARMPEPIAFFSDVRYNRAEGARTNSDFADRAFLAGVGVSIGERRHNFVATIDLLESRAGSPGGIFTNDPDDRFNNRYAFASFGYQHRLAFDNRIIGRFVAGTENVTRVQPRNNIDILGVQCGTPCNSRGKEDDRLAQVQFRHLFSWRGVDITYGVEGFFDRFISNSRSIEPGVGVFTDRDKRRIEAKQAYAQAQFKPWPTLNLVVGAYVRDLETEILTKAQIDPRFGIAWRPLDKHWIRAAFQQKLVFPDRAAETIAPVDAVGLVVPDQFFAEFEGGQRVDDYRARWESEWTPRLFTYAEASRQDVRDYDDADGNVALARVEQLRVGANVWLGEAIGLSVRGELRSSENRITGRELPGIAEHTFDASLMWINPRQVVVGVSLGYVGERFDDLANTVQLDGYWTSSASVRWESPNRRWMVTGRVDDILDEAPLVRESFPSAGRSASIQLEYRY